MTLVYLALAWGCGILAAHLLRSAGVIGCATPGWPFGAIAGAALAGLILAGRRSRREAEAGEVLAASPIPLPQRRRIWWPQLASALLLMAVLGAWRYQAQPFEPCFAPNDLAFYNGNAARPAQVTVEGVIVGYPDVRDVRTFYRLRSEKLTIGSETRPVRGDVLVQAARFPAYRYGDRLRVTGYLQTPPTFDDFDYRAYLALRGIHSLLRQPRSELWARNEGSRFWAALYGLRARGSALLNRLLPEPAAALANGMLLGIESGIPPAIDEAFKATGTSHVIVISGSNIALLAGVLIALLGSVLGKRRAALPIALLILLYVLLVGADPAALRAGLMGILLVIGAALGRQSTAFVSLCFAAMIMTLVNPLALWDIGFQLSFMATLGLILFTPPIQARFERFFARYWAPHQARQAVRLLNDALIVTLAAQVTTLPLIVYYFGRLSPVSLLTNFLILPVQPFILMGGLGTLVVGLAWEPLGRVLAAIPWLFLTYTTAIVRLTAAVPFASVETGAAGRTLALIYLAILFGALALRGWWPRSWAILGTRRTLVVVTATLLPTWLTLTAVNSLPDGRLRLTFVPGEGSEAVAIVTPDGRRIWIWDGAGDGAALAAATRSATGQWPRADVVLAPTTAAFWPGAQTVDAAELAPGTALRLGAEITLTRLAGEGGWLLNYGRFRTLLPTTLKPETQATLLARTQDDLRMTLLKAPGPSTGAWPTVPWLAATAPQVILWPLDTTYPPDVAAWLTAHGARRVPADAWLDVVTDGERLWLSQRSSNGQR